MQIASVIHLTKRATRLKLKHIPRFLELSHSADYLIIKTSSQPHCLKDLMRNRKLIADKGWAIVLQLLNAYEELKKVGATLRVINPSNIFV